MNLIIITVILFFISITYGADNKGFIGLLEDCTYYYYKEQLQINPNFDPNTANLDPFRKKCTSYIADRAVDLKSEYIKAPSKTLTYYIRNDDFNQIVLGCMFKKRLTTNNSKIISMLQRNKSDLSIEEDAEWQHWINNIHNECLQRYTTNMEFTIKNLANKQKNLHIN